MKATTPALYLLSLSLIISSSLCNHKRALFILRTDYHGLSTHCSESVYTLYNKCAHGFVYGDYGGGGFEHDEIMVQEMLEEKENWEIYKKVYKSDFGKLLNLAKKYNKNTAAVDKDTPLYLIIMYIDMMVNQNKKFWKKKNELLNLRDIIEDCNN